MDPLAAYVPRVFDFTPPHEEEKRHVNSFRRGHAVMYLVEELCNKPEGRGFDFR
jgi:hypothetical protein